MLFVQAFDLWIEIKNYLHLIKQKMKVLKVIGVLILIWAVTNTIIDGYSQIGWEIFLAVLPVAFLIGIFLYFKKRYKVKDKI